MPDLGPDHALSTEAVAVMFSGGRDSTLAAAYYAELGKRVHLLTFENLGQHATEITALRVIELRARWPDPTFCWLRLSATKLMRDIALADLVADLMRHNCNLVCVGSALAMAACAIDYCLTHSIKVLAAGYSSYQRRFPEQSPAALKFWTSFAQQHGIDFEYPMAHLDSEDQARDMLERLGLSPKALESTGLWDWTYSENVSSAALTTYLASKSAVASDHILRLREFRNAPRRPSDLR